MIMLMVELEVLLLAMATCTFALPPEGLLHHKTPEKQYEDQLKAPTQLLQALGISQPGNRRWHSEPPQYMLDLYNQVADPSGLTTHPSPYGATVIKAFLEREGNTGSTFVFPLNGSEEEFEEDVLEVELHVHHSRLQHQHRHLLKDNLYMVEVSAELSGERLVLSKQHVTAHNSGWRVFQVGSWVTKVMRDESKEEEEVEKHIVLQVIAKSLDGHTLPVVFHHGHQGTRRPLLVLFSTSTEGRKGVSSTSWSNFESKDDTEKKDSKTSSEIRVRRSVTDSSSTLSSSSSSSIPSGCERRDMLVDFASIGWTSWIVAPLTYNAYQCVGQCRYPLGQDLNPTNHATVQSFMEHSGDFPQVQRPCCVPSTYGNLSLLYIDADENVVLKVYEKMVATECGCH